MARDKASTLTSTDITPEPGLGGSEAPARPVPTLAVVLEPDRPGAGCFATSLRGIRRAVIGRGKERGASVKGEELTLAIPDRRASKPHAAIERRGDAFVLSDLESSNGTFIGFEAAPCTTATTIDFDRPFRVGNTVLVLLRDGGPILERTGSPWPFPTLSCEFARELSRLEKLASSTLPLLILGETGTGKEVLARAVHGRSGRPGPFVAVNCGALPPNLVEAHLFGHVKGAFSGALRDELGFVRTAQHGTLFLDEIGDLAPSAQASLLRVLQEGEVTPVGAFHPAKVDVRILSATHQPLRDRVAQGVFRADLLARLAGFSFQVPPLRERRFDVGQLLAAFWPEAPPIEALRPEAAMALLAYDYPMNVRELKQAIDAATVLAKGGTVALSDLPDPIARGTAAAPAPGSAPPRPMDEEDAALREELRARLEASGYNLTQVAREMGKARQQVQRWVKRFGLKPRG